jgi:hypothetical protein
LPETAAVAARQVARICAFDAAGKRFNRRRNDVSDHHAALVKFRHLTKPSGGGRNAAAA